MSIKKIEAKGEMEPKNWIKQVESLALSATDQAMWGALPSFPWESLNQRIQTAFEIEGLEIQGKQGEWKKGSEILSGMGESPLHLAFELSPLKGSCSLILPAEECAKLCAWIIHPSAENEGFSDPFLQKGFFRYLCSQIALIFEELKPYEGLTPLFVEMPLAKEEAYSLDIAITYQKQTVWGRLLCPTLFQQSLKAHFAKGWNLALPSHLYQELLLSLSITAGKTTLSQESMSQMELGDFIILDQCSYFPKQKKGTFQLILDENPLFHIKLKENGIKIVDYANYFEEQPMEDEPFEETMDMTLPDEGAVEEREQSSMISPKKVPVTLSVEVARLKMTLDQLLKLKPGTLLELGVHAEQGVDLAANGKCVGKGELLQIGDVIGVKILKLGA